MSYSVEFLINLAGMSMALLKLKRWLIDLSLRAVYNVNKWQIAEKLERMSRTAKVLQPYSVTYGNDNGIVTKQNVYWAERDGCARALDL